MLAIGNGESRSKVNLSLLKCPKVGCNAILRDFAVDHLVCVDRKMVKEAIESNILQTTAVYTRPDWIREYQHHFNVRQVPELPYKGDQRWDEPFHWGSGPYCVLLACQLTETRSVDLIGFDLYSQNQTVNNMYKGTDNYSDATSRPVDPRYWIRQIGKLFEVYNDIDFRIYQKEDWQLPETWVRANVTVDSIEKLSETSFA